MLNLLPNQTPHPRIVCGLDRIAAMLNKIIRDHATGKETKGNSHSWLATPERGQRVKKKEAKNHEKWLRCLPPETTLLYTDGSKDSKGITSLAWYCCRTSSSVRPPISWFEGKCQIGNNAAIEDGEIQVIQEAMNQLNRQVPSPPRDDHPLCGQPKLAESPLGRAHSRQRVCQ